MDFGSFLRQRQQKQQGASSSSIGNSASSSNDSWAINRPFTNAGSGRGEGRMTDSVYFDGPSEKETWNQPDPYQSEVDCFPPEHAAGQYAKFGPDERGFRGRGVGPKLSGGQRGNGSSTGGFGRGMQSQMDDFQPWNEASTSFGQPAGYDDEIGNFQHHGGNEGYVGFGDGSDMMRTATGHGGNLAAEQSMDKQGSGVHDETNEKGPRSVKSENVDTKKKPAKEIILRTDEEKKALEEFDIMQVNINWTHFGISKGMLIEASSAGKQPISVKKNYDITKLEFYCKLCDVQTVSAGNFHDHMVGKKHKMKAEHEVDANDTNADSGGKEKDDKTWNTYGGTIGFDIQEEKKDESVDEEQKTAAYEKNYYENFNVFEANVDWSSSEITESMLKEACFETKVPKFEDRIFDLFNLQFYCKLCDVQSTSTVTFHDHLIGKKHKSRASREMNPSKAKNQNGDEEDENELSEQENALLQDFDIFAVNLNWEHYNITNKMLLEASTEGIPGISQRRKKKKEIDVSKLEFYCKLCASQMVSAGNFHDHLVGKKHKQAYQEHLKGFANPGEQSVYLKPEELGQKSVLEDQMTEVQKPVLGLDHIIEMQSQYDIWCICQLCGIKCRSKVAMKHVLGMRHKLLYMRKHHPEVYEKMKRLQENNLNFYQPVDKHAMEKEESDGRGKPTIKCFKANQEGDPEDSENKDNAKVDNVHDFIQWVNSGPVGGAYCAVNEYSHRVGSICLKRRLKSLLAVGGASELQVSKSNFLSQFKERSISPILLINRTSKADDKGVDNKPQDFDGPSYSHDHIPPLMSNSSRGRQPPLKGRRPRPFLNEPSRYEEDPLMQGRRQRPLLVDPLLYEDNPLHPPLLPPPHHDPYLERDLLSRDRFMDRDPLLRDMYFERDPLLRDRYFERDPLLRERFMEREQEDIYLERDPLLRARFMDREKEDWYMERDPLLRKRFMEREKGMNRESLTRDRNMDRGPFLDTDCQPNQYRNLSREPEIRERNSRPDPYMDSEAMKLRPGAKQAYLDPDPLKRPRKLDSSSDPNPLTRPLTSDPYIDPDPLKRVLPSQKAKAKPVIIDYGHGKEEKSEKSKAKEWEDDINDILDSGRKSKGPDSLALLSSSYSSPKREKSPSFGRRTKPLPFERSYLDRAKDIDLLSGKAKTRESDSSYSKRKHSRSPDYSARNPDYPAFKYNRKKHDSPPLQNAKINFDRISISSESPPWVDSPNRSATPKKRRYVKSPKFKKVNSKSSSSSSSSSSSRSNSSRSSSRSRSSSDSPPRSRKYLRPKSPSGPVRMSIQYLTSLKQSSPPGSSQVHRAPLPRSRSPFKLSRRSKSKSPSVSLSRSIPPPRPSPTAPLPKALPPAPPLPTSPPPKSPNSHPRSKTPSVPLHTSPPPSMRSPPRKLSRSKSPSGSFFDSLPIKSSPPPRTEPRKSAAVDIEDAHAERIANMLLNMKSSIVGSEMDDPHAALQALLSSHELTEALLATRAESSTSQERGGERRGAGMASDQSLEHETEMLVERASQKSTSSREKVAFAFAGKSSVSSRNVPQTFLEEESSDEDH